jgi:hypothetical protein
MAVSNTTIGTRITHTHRCPSANLVAARAPGPES